MLMKTVVCLMIFAAAGLAVVCLIPPAGEYACGSSPPPPPDIQAMCEGRGPHNSVPEPGTLALVLVGMVALRAFRRRA
jgi:hypothetical protein